MDGTTSAVLDTAPIPIEPVGGVVSVGVLVVVPQPWADEIVDVRRAAGDPQAEVSPPHITLLPPTAVPIRAMPVIRSHLARVGAQVTPFRVSLLGTDSFRPVSPVVFLRVGEGAQQCTDLQSRVNTGVLRRPLFFDYHPHVTLGHDLLDDILDALGERMASFAASFVVQRFALYTFDAAGRWDVDTTVVLGGS